MFYALFLYELAAYIFHSPTTYICMSVWRNEKVVLNNFLFTNKTIAFSSDFHHSKSFEVLQSFHMPMLKPMLCSAHLSFALFLVLFCCIMIIGFPPDKGKCDLNSLKPQATITTA